MQYEQLLSQIEPLSPELNPSHKTQVQLQSSQSFPHHLSIKPPHQARSNSNPTPAQSNISEVDISLRIYMSFLSYSALPDTNPVHGSFRGS